MSGHGPRETSSLLVSCSLFVLLCVEAHTSEQCLDDFRRQTSRLVVSSDEVAVIGVESSTSHGLYSVPAGLASTGHFEIGSLTKPMLYAIVRRLAKAGTLELSTSVRDMLPETSDGIGAVTIRQLLDHRSGLPTNPTNLIPARPYDPFMNYDSEKMLEFLQYARVERKGEKGFLYSNAGYGLAGLMIEHATGRTLERHFNDYFQSLGMLSSSLGWRNQNTHMSHDGSRQSSFGRGMVAAGGVVANPEDIGVYLSHLLSTRYRGFSGACELREFCDGWFMEGDKRYRWHTGRTANFESFIGFGDGFGLFVLARSERRLNLAEVGHELLINLEQREVCGHGEEGRGV